MIGGSLGIRQSASFGSLEQQLENGGHSHHHGVLPRRPSKTSLPLYREKERSFMSAFRYLSRKKIGMLILVAIMLTLTSGFFTVHKEDVMEGADLQLKYKYVNKVSVCNAPGWETILNASLDSEGYSGISALTHNSCQKFVPPPPPANTHRGGPRPCPVCYLPVEEAMTHMPKMPPPSDILQYLSYYSEDYPTRNEGIGTLQFGGASDFGGYPSLKMRNNSFAIKEVMTIHCGFVKGCKPGHKTGFDISMADRALLEQFHTTIVASAIFGNYDEIHQPESVSEFSKRNIPFFMFVDEETEDYFRNSSLLSSDMHVGLWRIIVVHNLPYVDARRNGKVPKLLLHRLFPNTRYSIWIDAKLQLLVDPYQILERFLWRQNAAFAISRHYTRFNVFEEAEANKAGGKYMNASIDHQIEFYTKEGLTPYTEAKLPITSDVPEGCVLIREHVPITNLFSCLWFNEVDRFTSRDQLSFSTVRDKIQSQVSWRANMFLDCERRSFVKQEYHRDVMMEKALHPTTVIVRKTHPPHVASSTFQRQSPPRISIVHRGREKKPISRRRHRSTTRNKESFFS